MQHYGFKFVSVLMFRFFKFNYAIDIGELEFQVQRDMKKYPKLLRLKYVAYNPLSLKCLDNIAYA